MSLNNKQASQMEEQNLENAQLVVDEMIPAD